MTLDEKKIKAQELISQEVAADHLEWWYLSFAADTFRGAVIIRAFGLIDAVQQTHALNINPGGEVMGIACGQIEVKPEWCNRLLSLADMERLEMKPKKVADLNDA